MCILALGEGVGFAVFTASPGFQTQIVCRPNR